MEFMKVIGPLTDPTAHGGKAEDAFHVIAPTLPGFGFSDKPTQAGWGVPKIAMTWIKLMARLGYSEWVAQGGDWGAGVTTAIGLIKPEGCKAIHVNMPVIRPEPSDLGDLTDREKAAMASLKYYQDHDSGYSKQQQTRPQTIGYGLVDSPIGQAAWVYEKMWAWIDHKGAPEDVLSRDEMLDNIMFYWLGAAGASSARLYWESFGGFGGSVALSLPVGVSIFPKEIMRPSRRWAERHMSNIIHWNELDRGGHFAAWEQPELYVKEIRDCFRHVR
jgi:pimeloyl-ACP methyl ester carboxylesterase